MTTMRSQYSPASARSWVISSTDVPAARTWSRIRSMTTAWVVTSRPVVGSSAISRKGSQAIAIAIITRWHSPPDSSNG